MGSGWFNLVLTLCAVRGLGRTMGYEKAKLSGEGLAEGDSLGVGPTGQLSLAGPS